MASPVTIPPLMHSIQTQAIVLKKTAYGDDDWIVTLLTQEGGLHTFFAPHARKSQKRFGTSIDLFNLLQVTGKRKSPEQMPSLDGAQLLKPMEGVCEDVAKFAVACYLSEIILEFLQAGQNIPELFSFLLKKLNQMNEETVLSHHFVPQAEHHLLELFGFKPQLSSCLHCAKSIVPGGHYFFDGAKGSVICVDCSSLNGFRKISEQRSYPLSFKAIEGVLKKGSTWEREDALQIRRAFEHFIQYTAGKPFKSLKFLTQILASN